jgi:hypothetical protein
MSGPEMPRDALFDAALGAGCGSAADDRLREAVLAQTVGVIRFRRRLRRCALAAAMAGCYLAGVASVAMWTSEPNARQQAASQQLITDRRPVVAPPSAPVTPVKAERRAAPVRLSRFEVLRLAADRSLLEQGDVQAAVHNYKLALDLATAEQRAIAPAQDTWLLMALKDARAKEKHYAQSQ